MPGRAACRQEGPREVVAMNGQKSGGRPEPRCFYFPVSMLNDPSSWVWFAHRPRQPHRVKATQASCPIQHGSPATQRPPQTQGAETARVCHIDGCGRTFPSLFTAAQHAFKHLRLIRPWTSELIDGCQLTQNEAQQLRGCCEVCGKDFLPRHYLYEHALGEGTGCRQASSLTKDTLYTKCCALRDESERSVPTVRIQATETPIIRVEWGRYPAGALISPTKTAYVLSRIDTTAAATAPVAIYQPIPITDAFGTRDRLNAAHLVVRQRQQDARPSPSPVPGAQQPPANRAQLFEFLLVSPPPLWHLDDAETTAQHDQAQAESQAESSYGGESVCGSESSDGGDSQIWSESEMES